MNPEHRNNGVGKALFAELAKIAQEKVRNTPFVYTFSELVDALELCTYGLGRTYGIHFHVYFVRRTDTHCTSLESYLIVEHTFEGILRESSWGQVDGRVARHAFGRGGY